MVRWISRSPPDVESYLRRVQQNETATQSADVPLRTDGVNFVDENNTWCVFFRYSEKLAYKLGPISQVLLNKLGTNDAEECRGCLVGDSLG